MKSSGCLRAGGWSPTEAARVRSVPEVYGGQPHRGLVSHTEGTDGDFQVASHTTVGFVWLAEAKPFPQECVT